jgi:hypothetical protein
MNNGLDCAEMCSQIGLIAFAVQDDGDARLLLPAS